MNQLFLKYLNSVKLFEAPNDQGADKPPIKVDSVDNRGKNENKDVVGREEDEKKPDEENEKTGRHPTLPAHD